MNAYQVICGLKETSKGKLKYDPLWHNINDLSNLIDECNAAPVIKKFSNKKNTLGQGEDCSFKEFSEISETYDGASPSIIHAPSTQSNLVSKDKRCTSIFELSNNVDDLHHRITDIEQKWDKQAKLNVHRKRILFEQHSEMLAQKAETKSIENYLQLEERGRKCLQEISALSVAGMEESKLKQQRMREHHRQHAKLLDAKMKEAEQKRKLQEQEEKRRIKELELLLQELVDIIQRMKTSHQNIMNILIDSKYSQHFTDQKSECDQILTRILAKSENVLLEANQHEPTSEHKRKLLELEVQTKQVEKYASSVVDSLTQKMIEAEKQALQQAKAKASTPDGATKPPQPVVPATPSTNLPGPTASSSPAQSLTKKDGSLVEKDEVLCVASAALEEYTKLQELRENTENEYKILASTPELKRYKFDLQKAINTTVNAISAVSGSHLREKLVKMHNILTGQTVKVSNKHVSCLNHPAGKAFVLDSFAKKIVQQGEEQVASNHASAFPCAALTVGVWSQVPDVGPLLRARFEQKCPYLVPYYPPRQSGQSEEEYYRLLGYNYSQDGKREEQDKFLKRMSGLTRLYASILVSVPPSGAGTPHPHGIEWAWIWLSRLMNMEPRPDITPAMIYDMLEVTGHALWKTYNKQFVKLLQLLLSDYMPKIKTASVRGSAVTRLELYLQNCIKSGSIAPPEGMLSNNFWSMR